MVWSVGTGPCPAAADTTSWRAPPRASARRGVRSSSVSIEPDTSPRATLKARRGLARSSHGAKVAQDSLDCSTRCARCHTDRPGGAMRSSSREANSAARRSSGGCSATRTAASANPNASTATISRVGNAVGKAAPNKASPTRANVAPSRGEPADRVGTRRLHGDAGEIQAAVGGPDAEQSTETRRHPHRSAAIGAQREVARPARHRGGRAAGGAAGHAVGGGRVARRSVMGVLAEDAERHFVGDCFSDNRCT